MKRIHQVLTAPERHWVGDGFPVRTLFHYEMRDVPLSPFLLLDHAGPATFPGDGRRRGVGAHPHRGFETVTIVYAGEVAHRDSAGGGGTIGPGDVQWMTAGGGVVHEEFHAPEFARRGGALEMVQLWVNLPAAHKRTAPRYQAIEAARIPELELPGNAGRLRVIAGAFEGQAGPASTFSPVDVWDVRLRGGARVSLPSAAGRTLLVAVRTGRVQIGDERVLDAAEVAVLDPSGTDVTLRAEGAAELLVLGGEPLDDPVVGRGPFVMTSDEEIREAIADFQSGRFGRVPR